MPAHLRQAHNLRASARRDHRWRDRQHHPWSRLPAEGMAPV